MSKDLKVTREQQGEVTILNLDGDVTAVTGEAIESAYREASTNGTRKFLLNFQEESYINSGGIAILIGIAAESRGKEQVIRLTGLSNYFTKIFSMVGLTKYAEVFPSAEAALENI